MVGFISLHMAWFGVLYTDLLQAQTQASAATETRLHTPAKAAADGLGRLARRAPKKNGTKRWTSKGALMHGCQRMQLSKLLMQLHKPTLAHTRAGTQLLNWQWQPINDGLLGALLCGVYYNRPRALAGMVAAGPHRMAVYTHGSTRAGK